MTTHIIFNNLNFLKKTKLVTINYKSFFKIKIHSLFLFVLKLKLHFLKLNNELNGVFNLTLNYSFIKKIINKNIILKAPNRFKVAREKFQQKKYSFHTSFHFLDYFFISNNIFDSFFLINVLFIKFNYLIEYLKIFSFFIYYYIYILPSGLYSTLNFSYRYKYIQLYFTLSDKIIKKLFTNFNINKISKQLFFLKNKIKSEHSNFFLSLKKKLYFSTKIKKSWFKTYLLKSKKYLNNKFSRKYIVSKNYSKKTTNSKYTFYLTKKLHTLNSLYFFLKKKLYFYYRFKNNYCLNFFFLISNWFKIFFFLNNSNNFIVENVLFDYFYYLYFLNNYILILLSKYSYWYINRFNCLKRNFKNNKETNSTFFSLKVKSNFNYFKLDLTFLILPSLKIKLSFISILLKLYN